MKILYKNGESGKTTYIYQNCGYFQSFQSLFYENDFQVINLKNARNI